MAKQKSTSLCGVYKIECLANGKVYVGSSLNVLKRWGTHRNLLSHNSHPNIHLQRAWNMYGGDSFDLCVLEECEPDTLLGKEQEWMVALNACDGKVGFNISLKAGAPMAGRKHTDETKKRFSAIHSGVRHTEEAKAKISATHKGVKFTPEHLENMRRARLGKKASEKTRALLRQIHKNPSPELRYKNGNGSRGKKQPREQVERSARSRMQHYLITDPEFFTYDIWGLARFCREHGLDQGSMTKVAQGACSAYKGWKCERVEPPI